MENSKYLSVGALTRYLKYKFDQDPYLTRVFLKGELSNVKRHTSGHVFFAIKDEQSVVRAIMFSRNAGSLKFKPEEGQSVLVEGRVSIFESSGQYQVYVEKMEMDGIGLLFEKLEQDKKQLAEKGYFDAQHKKPLPRYPRTITIISSETGAAVKDMITTLGRRYPLVSVTVINTLMQGPRSRQAVIDNLGYADRLENDVIILARGGGSIEDLWTFNEKDVALKIFEMSTPVITGIGHETDTTLVDFIADVRAATPTAAAEMAVPDQQDILERLHQSENHVSRRLAQKLDSSRSRLDTLGSYYKLKNPDLLYDQQAERLVNLKDTLDDRMHNAIKDSSYRLSAMKESVRYNTPGPEIRRGAETLMERRGQLDRAMRIRTGDSRKGLVRVIESLNSLSPTNVLLRGYSFTTHKGTIVKDAHQLELGDEVQSTFAEGSIVSKVTEVNHDGRN
ncbi:exodeoxyribonuclease VII large subunit [Salinicoccus hispanicus]|uniref:Exodeoxyribonuclease 7 large subunit n=1 Tax=Salinicoccus hispanicus TaxID=157225 RepID=A0A6N8U251_9STAP|nr:exodeoxyribonuclease VII large subunit [Salinicoccus hispanicus]MXQ50221.1 exodeoxyribonuclease VII large subunit [Salinicoccus hispanicus]